ncbi:MAG: ferrous iron transport protein B [Desulfovibrio sp.]|nr:ferrous iron transport protein B [Desulfovibrio sp.]
MGDDSIILNEGGAPALRIALLGNPNCGKTTVFNRYTGAKQHVGNYPGVTVDRKEGEVDCGGTRITLVDLPGTYSLTAFSQEEIVVRRELASGNVHAAIDVAEASALERNLILTVQLLEMGMPTVLCCNMMDEAEKGGTSIDTERLGRLLRTPVVPMTAKQGLGLGEALEKAVRLARAGRREPLRLDYGTDVNPVLSAVEDRIAEAGLLRGRYHPHWVALKLIEADADMEKEAMEADAGLAAELKSLCGGVARHIRDTLGMDTESFITDHRFGYIRSVLQDGVLAQDPTKNRLAATDRIDAVLTHEIFGPVIMLAVLFLMYEVTIDIGAYPQKWAEDGIGWLGAWIGSHMGEGYLRSLLVDGVIGGVGGVVSFVPLIVIMFAMLSFLEDCGYMARMAYMMDRVFRVFGLHGASVMPYCVSGGIAGGCAIPGVMATRTLRSPKEKLATLLTLPYMTCGAKMPLFFMLATAFFAGDASLVMFLIMIAGWIAALLVAAFLRSTVIKGESTPFVLELPPYRFPTFFSVLLHCMERAWDYLKKAGTVLLAISVVLWAMMVFPELPEDRAAPFESAVKAARDRADAARRFQAGLAEAPGEQRAAARKELEAALAGQSDAENRLAEAALTYSAAGRIGKAIEPVFAPLGFDWRTDIALFAGVAAKEAVLGTLGTVWSMGEIGAEDEDASKRLGERLREGWKLGGGKATALALMLFVLMYSPCFVSLIVIKNEAGSWKWLFFSIVFNTSLAYAVAFVAYRAGRLIWG